MTLFFFAFGKRDFGDLTIALAPLVFLVGSFAVAGLAIVMGA